MTQSQEVRVPLHPGYGQFGGTIGTVLDSPRHGPIGRIITVSVGGSGGTINLWVDECWQCSWPGAGSSVHRTKIPDMWAVTHLGDCPILTRGGNWSYTIPRSLRVSCYMPLDEALAAAEKAADSLTVNGWTLSDAVDAAAHRARVTRARRRENT